MQEQEHKAGRGCILAVDDCEMMRELMRASLQSLGYEVQVADSGWAALEAASQGEFDAIVLDVEMPGLDGMAVGRALRLDPKTAKSAIAMHSSIAEATVRAGFNQYDVFVAKSASPLALGQRVDSLIRQRQV